MAYTTINNPKKHFDLKLYTGTGSSQAITGMELQPDWVWIKARENTSSHVLADSSRGVNKYMSSDTNNAEQDDSNSVTAFGSEGFTVGSLANVNTNTEEHVAWCWKANGGTTVSNSDGSITSTVQANTTAGFSIVTYTGTGSAATVGHGLGATPKMIWVKRRSTAEGWQVYHGSTIQVSDPETDYWELNTTAGTADNVNRWNDTAPTSTVFSIGTHAGVNDSASGTHTYVAYCFAQVKGYSHFGAYTGVDNNADGPMIYTGFRPRLVMIKRSDGVENWIMSDRERSRTQKDATVAVGGNPISGKLMANVTTVENTSAGVTDFYSTGFKIRDTDGVHNYTNYEYIYMAWADMPTVGSNGVPGLAR